MVLYFFKGLVSFIICSVISITVCTFCRFLTFFNAFVGERRIVDNVHNLIIEIQRTETTPAEVCKTEFFIHPLGTQKRGKNTTAGHLRRMSLLGADYTTNRQCT